MVDYPLEEHALPHLDTPLQPSGYVGIKVCPRILFLFANEATELRSEVASVADL